MNELEILRSTSFGQRVAEDESDLLASYFVETEHWRRVYSGEVDVIYGPKGSGKSALYSLLVARTLELFERNIIVTTAENPRGATAFRDLEIDPPASEREFIGLWKLYFASLLQIVFSDYSVGGADAKRLQAVLANEGLIQPRISLQTLLRSVWDYVRKLRVQSVEAGVLVNPATQVPTGLTGKITLFEPSAEQTKAGFISVDYLLNLANEALKSSSNTIVWILLDRLDVAFTDNPTLEINALRALFRVYLDMAVHSNLKLKIFLRTDIWNKLSVGGFREASHITKHMTIDWNRNSLLNLAVRRAIYNPSIQKYYDITPGIVLATTTSQESFFYKMCPEQVDVGARQSSTFDWILGRTKDGTGKNAPREVIHLLNCTRVAQVRRLELAEAAPGEGRLLGRGAFKEALPEVSQVRLEQTLYAEHPSLREPLEKLRGDKTQQSMSTLSSIWNLSHSETEKLAQELVEVGFFELRGTKDFPQYKVPFLYRSALGLIQGAAEID